MAIFDLFKNISQEILSYNGINVKVLEFTVFNIIKFAFVKVRVYLTNKYNCIYF